MGVEIRSWTTRRTNFYVESEKNMCGKKVGVFILFLAAAAFCIFEIYALLLFSTENTESLPDNFGNFVSVREQIKPESGANDFYFAVVGDTKGCGTFEKIYDRIRKLPVKFLVLLGDCVRKPTEGYHSYFRSECNELRPPFPVFFVVGNHDVNENNFSVSRFEEIYGPTNFFFKYHDQLFVFLRILNRPYKNTESLNFLEKVLKKERGSCERAFLFMHIPPKVTYDYQVKSIDGRDRLISLINKYKVDYVIGADFHGYARVTKGNTVYLVTGGGGAHLKRVKFKQFHHGIVFRVGKHSVSEHLIVVGRNEDFQDQVERYVLGEFVPFVKSFPVLVFGMNLLSVTILVYVLFVARSAWRDFRLGAVRLLCRSLDLFCSLRLCPHRGHE